MYTTRNTDSVHDICEHEHFAQLYNQDSDLITNLGKFIGAGLEAGESCLVISTPAHLTALKHYLSKRGIDLAAAAAEGRCQLLDGDETLSKFMVDGLPDRAQLRAILEEIKRRSAGKVTRAFGEMVATLWAQENHAAAILLEQQWNEFCRGSDLTLFCAYPLHHFESLGQKGLLEQVSRFHTSLIMPRAHPGVGGSATITP